MGRRRVSDTVDDSAQYYCLIPRGKGFPPTSVPMTEDGRDGTSYTAQAEHWRHELIEAYGYTTKRVNEEAKILSVKAAFINKLPEKLGLAKRALKLLVCDQATLFADNDPFYRSSQVNSIFLSAQKKENREYNKRQDECISRALNFYSKSPEPKARILLNEIVKDASKKHISVYDWLYSKRHLKEGAGRNSQDSIWDLEKLDIDRCREDAEQLLFRCGQSFRTEELDFERFINLAVTFYIQEQEKLKARCPEASSYRDNSLDSITIPAFKRRLACLEALEKEYDSIIPPTEALYKLDSWGNERLNEELKIEQTVSAIRSVVCRFLAMVKLSVGDPDFLDQRIRWALSLSSKGMIPVCLRPIFLLNMIMACQRNIFKDPIGDLIQPNEILTQNPLWFPRIDKACQRYAQLSLLDSLCQIFCLSDDEEKENLREFVSVYGKSMLSWEEILFWRRHLKGNYEFLPQIGFQLCFLNYCEQCVQPHYEHLNYRPFSKLHQGGYYRFYRRNRKALRTMSQQVCPKNRSSVHQHKVAWGKPALRGSELEKLLLQLAQHISFDISSLRSIRRYDLRELELLVLETVLQMQIRQDAIETLMKGFSTIYQVPLAVAHNNCLKAKLGNVSIP